MSKTTTTISIINGHAVIGLPYDLSKLLNLKQDQEFLIEVTPEQKILLTPKDHCLKKL